MKIHLDMGGAANVRPGFDVLQAGFTAAQAATPTARAALIVPPPIPARTALIGLYVGDLPAADAAAALSGRFNPSLCGDEDEQR